MRCLAWSYRRASRVRTAEPHVRALRRTRPPGGWQDATQTAKLTASDGAPGDILGNGVAESQGENAVAVSAGGNTIAAGAPTFCFACAPGAVYVFTRPPGGWRDETQAAKLTASDAGPKDQLGSAVAIDGIRYQAGRRIEKSCRGQADLFAAYAAHTKQVYVLEVDEVPETDVRLRPAATTTSTRPAWPRTTPWRPGRPVRKAMSAAPAPGVRAPAQTCQVAASQRREEMPTSPRTARPDLPPRLRACLLASQRRRPCAARSCGARVCLVRQHPLAI